MAEQGTLLLILPEVERLASWHLPLSSQKEGVMDPPVSASTVLGYKVGCHAWLFFSLHGCWDPNSGFHA